MAFKDYYVGSNLTDLGSMMTRDRQIDVAQQEQQRLQQAALMQALRQQQAQQEQARQFNQEMAYRNAALQQQGGYHNLLLGLKQKELEQQGSQAQMEDAYRREALKNSLDLGKIQFPPERWQMQDPRAMAEQLRQFGMSQRDQEAAIQDWEANAARVKSRAQQYNALLDSITKDAKASAEKQGWWWTSGDKKKQMFETLKRQRLQELIQSLKDDKLSEGVTFDPATEKFAPVLPPRPASPAQQQSGVVGALSPLTDAIRGLFSLNGLLGRPGGQPASQNVASEPVAGVVPSQQTKANEVSRVQTSDGAIWSVPTSAMPEVLKRDPNARVFPIEPPKAGIHPRTVGGFNRLLDMLSEPIDLPAIR